jgi:PIN like domain
MVAVADLVRFYVDQSASGLGLALTAARKDTIHCGHPLIPECPLSVLDPAWIPAVAARGLIVIARDKKLRTKPVEVRALWESGWRVFCIGGKKDLSTWEWLERIVKFWPKMEQIIEEHGAGPWIYMLNENAIVGFVPSWAVGDA